MHPCQTGMVLLNRMSSKSVLTVNPGRLWIPVHLAISEMIHHSEPSSSMPLPQGAMYGSPASNHPEMERLSVRRESNSLSIINRNISESKRMVTYSRYTGISMPEPLIVQFIMIVMILEPTHTMTLHPFSGFDCFIHNSNHSSSNNPPLPELR